METVPVELRKTHRYRLGWDFEDQWDYLGKAKITPERMIEYGDGDSDMGKIAFTAYAPAGVDPKKFSIALGDTFSHSCRCEHDCCGHVSRYARARRVKGRKYYVTVGLIRNC